MKTKELIKRLQELDPSGETEVLIGNRDISKFIYDSPAYWDGRAQVAEFDERGLPIKSKIITGGSKICLDSIDIEEKYFDSLVDEGKEYPIETYSTPGNWLYHDWLIKKLKWCQQAKHFSINHGDLEFIEEIKEVESRLHSEAIEVMKHDIQKTLSKTAKRVYGQVIKKMEEFDIPFFVTVHRNESKDFCLESRSSKYFNVAVEGDSIYTYNWPNRDTKTPFDASVFDWNALKEKIVTNWTSDY